MLTVSGYGLAVRGNGKTGGTLRAARLAVTGHPGNLQIRLVDPATGGARAGMGACTGDSGAPVFEGSALIGVVSWSTGPNNSAGCGGLTGITPLALYRNWIIETARRFGSPLAALTARAANDRCPVPTAPCPASLASRLRGDTQPCRAQPRPGSHFYR